MAFVLVLVLLAIVAAALWYVGSQKTIRAELLAVLLPVRRLVW